MSAGRLSRAWVPVLLALLFAWPETRAEQGAPAGYFRIHVVDEQSGRGIEEAAPARAQNLELCCWEVNRP